MYGLGFLREAFKVAVAPATEKFLFQYARLLKTGRSITSQLRKEK